MSGTDDEQFKEPFQPLPGGLARTKKYLKANKRLVRAVLRKHPWDLSPHERRLARLLEKALDVIECAALIRCDEALRDVKDDAFWDLTDALDSALADFYAESEEKQDG